MGRAAFCWSIAGPTPQRSREGLLTTVAWQFPNGPPTYALEGSAFVTGAAVQWLRDGLGLISNAAETEALAESVPDNGGVYMVPAFVGLGAPHWDMYARGLLIGLTGRHHPGTRGARNAGEHCLPVARPGGRHGQCRPANRGAQGRRRWDRQRLPDAVSGRRARGAGRGSRGSRDDGARRGLFRRAWASACGATCPSSRHAGGARGATSRA